MNKKCLIIIFCLALSNCKTDSVLSISTEDFIGKTFNVYGTNSDQNDLEIVAFQEFDFDILNKNYSGTWDLNYYEGIPILAMNEAVSGLKKINDSTFRWRGGGGLGKG